MFLEFLHIVFEVLELLADADVWLSVPILYDHLLGSNEIYVLLLRHWGHRQFETILPNYLSHSIVEGYSITKAFGVKLLKDLRDPVFILSMREFGELV